MKGGMYRQKTTALHAFHPTLKILSCLVFLFACAMTQTICDVVALVVFTILLMVFCCISLREASFLLKPMAPLIVFVVLLNVVCAHYSLAFISAVRFICSLIGAAILMMTTSPTELSDGVRILFSFISKKKDGKEGRQTTKLNCVLFAVQVTLRFVPVLFEELNELRQAQKERSGVVLQQIQQYNKQEVLADGNFDTITQKGHSVPKGRKKICFLRGFPAVIRHRVSNLVYQLKETIPLMVPLFESSLRRADMLAVAIDNRGFCSRDRHPSCIRTYEMTKYQIGMLLLPFVLLVLVIFM
jgi:energy-coupling factor transporter transmembrane protein EcfT